MNRQPAAVVTQIVMARSDAKHRHYSYLLVEGEDDVRLLHTVIDADACFIRAQAGVNRVLDALQCCRARHVAGVVAFIDRDYRSDSEVEELTKHGDLAVTETRDVETLMIRSRALDQLVVEVIRSADTGYVPPATIADWVRSYLLKAATPIGVLRSYVQSVSLGWSFQSVAEEAHQFIDFRQNQPYVSVENLVCLVSGKRYADSAVVRAVEEGINAAHDRWRVVHGHDCVTLLGTILPIAQKQFSKTLDVSRRKPSIDAVMRAGFQAEIRNSQLFRFFMQWQQLHTPYRVVES